MTIPSELETIARRLLAHRPEPDDGALLLRIAARVRFILRELDEKPVVVVLAERVAQIDQFGRVK